MFKGENKFSVGDVVVCVDDEMSDDALHKGEEYTVLSTYSGDVRIEGSPIYWMNNRFKLKEKELKMDNKAINWELGQEVWDTVFGRGVVSAVFPQQQVHVRYADKIRWYTTEGVLQTLGEAKNRSLFFSEPEIIADRFPPKKPFVPLLKKGGRCYCNTLWS